jgi:hypothetical protein
MTVMYSLYSFGGGGGVQGTYGSNEYRPPWKPSRLPLGGRHAIGSLTLGLGWPKLRVQKGWVLIYNWICEQDLTVLSDVLHFQLKGWLGDGRRWSIRRRRRSAFISCRVSCPETTAEMIATWKKVNWYPGWDTNQGLAGYKLGAYLPSQSDQYEKWDAKLSISSCVQETESLRGRC